MCNIFAFIFIAVCVPRVIHKYSALFGTGLIGSVGYEVRGKRESGGSAPACSSED